jgi:16S rRNA (cytosine967-C5)-methyltransferase
MKQTNPRWVALQIILKVVDQGRSLDDLFQGEWLQSLQLSRRDQGLVRELVYGLCRWYYTLAGLLDGRLQKPLRARDRDIECILLLGLYQLLVMRTESHAAVNETVNLVVAQKKKWARGLVNGVLRTVIRDAVDLAQSNAADAYPEWMRTRVFADWTEQAEQVLDAGNRRAPMTLRVDTRQGDVDSAIDNLASAGIGATRHPQVDSAIMLESPCDVSQLPGFERGLFSVQDAAAQLAAPLLSCEPGARVLDACAAPGGKTAHLLQHGENLQIDALDSSEQRMLRLRENLQRVGHSARILIGDAGSREDWYDGHPYDAILADVPCSASGVLRRHPDIKLLRRESDIMPLLERQASILQSLWSVLKPGGKMLYSTCSIFKDENESQIDRFLERQPDASAVSLDQYDWGQKRSHGRQILSGQDNMDGFYYALLTRSAI